MKPDYSDINRAILRECQTAWSAVAAPPIGDALERLTDVLHEVLQFPVDEPELAGLSEAIHAALRAVLLPAVERGDRVNGFKKLSELLEAFLKKLLCIVRPHKYHELVGSAKKPSLGDVLRACELATPRLLSAKSSQLLPEQPGFARAIGRAYEIRNQVHEAPEWSDIELACGTADILNVFLFACHRYEAEFATVVSRRQLSPYLAHLRSEVGKPQSRIVPLAALEDVSQDQFIDPVAVEAVDEEEVSEQSEAGFDGESDNGDVDRGEDDLDSRPREARRGPVTQLVNSVPRMVLLGDAGAGKTTTLRHVAYRLTLDMGIAPTDVFRCPVVVELRLCSLDRSFVAMARNACGLTTEWFDRLVAQGRLLLLLDGLNEIQLSCREGVIHELQGFLKQYPAARMMVTCRPEVYRGELGLPVFSIQAMTDSQMVEFLERNSSSPEAGRAFADVLRRHPRLWLWGRNPLALQMLARVGEKAGGELPANRGQLMRLFIKWILDREASKKHQTNQAIKSDLLGQVAYETRRQGKVAFSRKQFLSILKKSSEELGVKCDTAAFLAEVLDNNLMVDTEGELAFAHELYQEYFAAVALTSLYEESPDDVTLLAHSEHWREPIVLLHGLLESSTDLFARLIPARAATAADCLVAEVSPAAKQVDDLLERAANLARTATKAEYRQGFLVAAKFGRPDVFVSLLCDRPLSSRLSSAVKELPRKAAELLQPPPLPPGLIEAIRDLPREVTRPAQFVLDCLKLLASKKPRNYAATSALLDTPTWSEWSQDEVDCQVASEILRSWADEPDLAKVAAKLIGAFGLTKRDDCLSAVSQVSRQLEKLPPSELLNCISTTGLPLVRPEPFLEEVVAQRDYASALGAAIRLGMTGRWSPEHILLQAISARTRPGIIQTAIDSRLIFANEDSLAEFLYKGYGLPSAHRVVMQQLTPVKRALMQKLVSCGHWALADALGRPRGPVDAEIEEFIAILDRAENSLDAIANGTGTEDDEAFAFQGWFAGQYIKLPPRLFFRLRRKAQENLRSVLVDDGIWRHRHIPFGSAVSFHLNMSADGKLVAHDLIVLEIPQWVQQLSSEIPSGPLIDAVQGASDRQITIRQLARELRMSPKRLLRKLYVKGYSDLAHKDSWLSAELAETVREWFKECWDVPRRHVISAEPREGISTGDRAHTNFLIEVSRQQLKRQVDGVTKPRGAAKEDTEVSGQVGWFRRLTRAVIKAIRSEWHRR